MTSLKKTRKKAALKREKQLSQAARRKLLVKRLLGGIKIHLTSGGMTATLLDRLSKRLISQRNLCNFYGVFQGSQIPPHLCSQGRFSFICYLKKWGNGKDISPQKGQGHFVCIYATPTCIWYIDPYGLPCIQHSVLTFLKNCQRDVRCTTKQIQHKNSTFCGLYALLFTLYLATRPKFKLRFYKKSLQKNDDRCILFLRKIKFY